MTARSWSTIVLGLSMIASLGGCAAPLPTYRGMADDAALGLIADRLDSVRTVSSAADITLTSPDGRTVRLEGAFIAMPPERARLRAWKFGTPVLDLTVLPEGVWVYSPEAPGGVVGGAGVSSVPAANIAPALELLSGAYFRCARPQPDDSTGQNLTVTGPALGREGVHCDIDRVTLTPRRFRLDPAPGELLLGDYALIESIAWPHSLRFRNAEGEILVRLDHPELNVELPAGAFAPPARARRLP